MNPIIKNLTIQNLKNFINSFNESRNIFWDDKENMLRHSAEYGIYREELVKKWLRVFIPETYGISSGFIINSKGEISTQCDLIIYDKNKTPKIENIDSQRFFPVETVLLVGEIKSDINSMKDLNNYLIKLAKIKKMRDGVVCPQPYYRPKLTSTYSPESIPFDNIFSILICNKFNFKFDISKLDYEMTENRFKHNLVLSLNDGILNYKTNQGTDNLPYPCVGPEILQNNYLQNDHADLPAHIISFLGSLSMAVTTTTLLEIDMIYYLTDSIHEKIV